MQAGYEELYIPNYKPPKQSQRLKHHHLDGSLKYPLIAVNGHRMFWTILYAVIAHNYAYEEQLTAHPQHELHEEFIERLKDQLQNDVLSSNPESVLLFKERLNILLNRHHLTVDDTYGVEPLRSNFTLTPTFLELYGPIDPQIRLFDAIQKLRQRPKSTKPTHKSTYSTPSLRSLRGELRHKSATSTERYSTVDGRKVPLIDGGTRSIYQQLHPERAHMNSIKKARTRQDKRNELQRKECPPHLIEYYVTKYKRRSYLERDQQILQAMGQWQPEDERRFPTTNHNTLAGLPHGAEIQGS